MTAALPASHDDVRLLYLDHHGWLQGWLRRRLGDAADAADLAHDAFLRLIVKPEPTRFAGPAEARAYLKAMAHGMCVDRSRRKQVEQAWLDTLAAHGDGCHTSPEHRAIVIETLMEIGALLASLPEKARTAFLLAQIHGATTPQIAAQLGVSERMVQKYLASTMLHLAKLEAGLAG
ncbi:MAG: sigma-70 family RNA polymerase sigma factor [Burkholderia sp.]